MLPPRFFSKNITEIFGGKKIRRRRFILAGLVFAFWATCLLHPKIVLGEYSAENPPVLHVGDLTLRTHADKLTTPSLHIKPPGNQVFYIDLAEDNGYSHGLRIAYGGKVYSAGRYELFYEATSVNQCETVLLTPGGYCVDIRGGGGVAARYASAMDLVGGDSGSGSKGTSSTSYVKIYRLE